MTMVRTAVLASGTGTNLQAILDAAKSAGPFEVVLVLTDVDGCGALARSQAKGVPTEIVTWESCGGDRSLFTLSITRILQAYDVELVALAGFMRILTSEIIEAFPHAVLNTHPALLPAFRGAHAVEQALEYGVRVTGVTIHLIDEEVDHGPIVAQMAVDVLSEDNAASLRARLQEVEHQLFPQVLADWADGLYRVEGRRVIRLPAPGLSS